MEFVLGYAGFAFFLLAVFHGAAGIPEFGGDLAFVAAAACYYLLWRSWYGRASSTPGAIPPHSAGILRWVGPAFALAFVIFLVLSAVEIFHR